jgi:F-type H+-transporting ATPase subunit b
VGDILHISWQALVLQIVSFLVLIWMVRKFLFGPIGGILDARQTEVQSTLDQVYRDREAMETSRREYEARLAGIESEARDRIQAAIKDAQGMKEEIIGAAHTEADRLVNHAREEIVREKQRAMVELRTQVADLAVDAAGKILRRSVDERAHRELVTDFINQVGAS